MEINALQYIRILHQVESYPTMIVVQSRHQLSTLVKRLPALDSYPLVRIHASEPSGLFNVLDWQRIVLRRIIKHYFNMFLYLHVRTKFEFALLTRNTINTIFIKTAILNLSYEYSVILLYFVVKIVYFRKQMERYSPLN